MQTETFNAIKEAARVMWYYHQIKNNYISLTEFMHRVQLNDGKYPDGAPEYIFADYEYIDECKKFGTTPEFEPGELLVALIDMDGDKVVVQSRNLDKHKDYSIRISEWIMDNEEEGEEGELNKVSVVGGLIVKNRNNEDFFEYPFIKGFPFAYSDMEASEI